MQRLEIHRKPIFGYCEIIHLGAWCTDSSFNQGLHHMTEKPARKSRATTSDRVKQDMPAFLVVSKFGGLSRFCEICDFAFGTVHGWLESGLVPAKMRDGMSYQAWILAKAHEHKIDMGPADFIDTPAD